MVLHCFRTSQEEPLQGFLDVCPRLGQQSLSTAVLGLGCNGFEATERLLCYDQVDFRMRNTQETAVFCEL